ncbi:DgyrCDS4698 [Dimorphilus gyrociliatus]|uniref:Signal transducer and activator of transcription n=2 Tax=Dimorphilus gyrociliatus TaxID=2664684 RepID=A0A7I8VKE3_9ANNE|nr:DgyrCDS4698 [Dimorphilus gyrociliatus]
MLVYRFSVGENNPASANDLRDNLCAQLMTKAEEQERSENIINRFRLRECAESIQNHFSGDQGAMKLVQTVRHCLNAEREILSQVENSAQPYYQQQMFHQSGPVDLNQILSDIAQEKIKCENALRLLQQKQEHFIIKYQDNAQTEQQINSGKCSREVLGKLQEKKRLLQNELTTLAQQLLNERLALADLLQNAINGMMEAQKIILEERLIEWKRAQQLHGNGYPDFQVGHLDVLQKWCEDLAVLTWSIRQQLKRLQLLRQQLPIALPTGKSDIVPGLLDQATQLLSQLITSTFVIESQPPQVLKKDARFSAKVRLLVGAKLSVHLNPPTVKATIISEEQARVLLRTVVGQDQRASHMSESCGDILNNSSTMEVQNNGQQQVLVVTFRNMALKRIKRAEKKGNETVTEEKFSILFQSSFTVGEGELVFQVWTLSLPVVVIVHGNQEPSATATVLWDNAFAQPARPPFAVPDEVLWPDLSRALNMKFTAAAGASLNKQHMDYLASKLFGVQEEYSNCLVKWSAFNKEPLSPRNFTFWEWFYNLLKLVKEWLHDLWKDGLIHGFVSKQQASNCLLNSGKPGTFMLRFSDSELGGLTISFLGSRQNGASDHVEVLALQPYSDKDFRIRGLADRVKDIPSLLWLYPDRKKEEAFLKHWGPDPSNAPSLDDGYVPTILVSVVPGIRTPEQERQQDAVQQTTQNSTFTPIQNAEGSISPQDLAFLESLDHFGEINDLNTMMDYNPCDIINANQFLYGPEESEGDPDHREVERMA